MIIPYSTKDNIQGYNKAIDHVENHNAEYSKDMTQDVINAYKKSYGVGDREASRTVLNGEDSAQKIFRQISGDKANNILQQVRSAGTELNSSNNVSDFMNRNQDAVQNNVGSSDGEVSKFAQDKGMKSENEVTKGIIQTGDNLKEDHERKLQQKSYSYKDASIANTNKQETRRKEIDKLEEDRIGKGMASKVIAGAGNVVSLGNSGWGIGRPSPTESQEEVSGPRVIRPGAEFTSEDASDTKGLIKEFNPNNNKSEEDTSLAKGSHQYVDPSKNNKG